MNKRIMGIVCAAFAAIIMIFCCTACNSKTDASIGDDTAATQPAPQDLQTPVTEAIDDTEADTPAADKVLVVYFSATGTTKGVAEKIAAIENADLYEIVPAELYSDADLDWNDKSSRTTIEQNDITVRPAIAGKPISLEGYSIVFIGYPIWWGEEPRIMDTFAENYDFTGKTVIPFCTSGGSGIGRSGRNLEELTKTGAWVDGKRLQANISDDDLRAWIDGLIGS